MWWVGFIASLCWCLSGVAMAGPFSAKTMQGPLHEREVARPFVLPKGWLEVGVMGDTKRSQSYRGSDGIERDYTNAATWSHSRLWLHLRQGFSPRFTLYARVPWVHSALVPAAGPATSTLALGDVHTGVVWQPQPAGPHAWAFSLDLKSPSGLEWPSGTGSASDTHSFLTGTGITNLSLYGHGKLVFSEAFGLAADAGYARKIPGVVGYVTEMGGFGNGVLNPGDEWQVNGHLTGQPVRMLWLRGSVRYRYLHQTWMGVSGPQGPRIVYPLRHTAGGWLVGAFSVGLEPGSRWTMHANVSRDFIGADSRTFAHLGLEEFSPQPGLTLGFGVSIRW